MQATITSDPVLKELPHVHTHIEVYGPENTFHYLGIDVALLTCALSTAQILYTDIA